MEEQVEFSFGEDAIAIAYDKTLVPSLFEPWAAQLIDDHKPWIATTVLDLACGTGVVTKELAKNVGPKGKVIALDFSSQMLRLAKQKCEKWANQVNFVEGSAESIALPDNSIDTVVCQQGFQFFPNKKAAANEIYRVLKPQGRAIIATWCPVSVCEIFGVICDTLEALDENEISQMMRVPFDLLTEKDLEASFDTIGFSEIHCSQQEQKLFIKGAMEAVIEFAYATPIRLKLKALSSERQLHFQQLFISNLQHIVKEDGSFGRMVSNILYLRK